MWLQSAHVVSYARLLNFSSVRVALIFQSIVGFRTVQQQFQNGLAERISKLVDTHFHKNNTTLTILINHNRLTPIISLPPYNPCLSPSGIRARFRCRGLYNRIRNPDPRIQPGQRPECGDRFDREPCFTHCADGFWFAKDYTCWELGLVSFFDLARDGEEKVQGERGWRKKGVDVLERQTLHTNPTSNVL